MRRHWFPRRRRPAGEVMVTLEADTSHVLAAFERGAEDIRILKYRQRLRHERFVAQAQVGVLLDDMCRAYGWDPVDVWRVPRFLEEQERRDQARLRAAWWAGAAIPHTMLGGGA